VIVPLDANMDAQQHIQNLEMITQSTSVHDPDRTQLVAATTFLRSQFPLGKQP
jgi:hypothetical protein